jgi:molybdopterin converting factor small subunit
VSTVITVRLPSTLCTRGCETIEIREAVGSIAELVDLLDRRIPGFREQLEDSVFNFAVNDEMLLYHARERTLKAGDTVEVVPTLSGG